MCFNSILIDNKITYDTIMKSHIRPIAPLSKGQVSGHVICPVFPWKHCWVHRVRALEHKVRVLEMEQSSDSTVAALSNGSYCQLHSGCWKRATIIKYSRGVVKLSCIDPSAVTKRLGTTALEYIFQTFILDKIFLGHQQCSQLCATCEKQDPSSSTRFKLFVNYDIKRF